MKTILVLGFGGTVAGVGKSNDYTSGVLNLEEVFRSVDYEKQNIRLRFDQISDGDGVDKSGEGIMRLVSIVRSKQDLHGVDTILGPMGTDMAGSFMTACTCLRWLGIPFIGSGAQLPATALVADGPRNISDAIMVAVHHEAYGRGAMFGFNGKIMREPSIGKKSVTSNDAFESLPDTIGHAKDGCVYFDRSHNSYPTPILESIDLFVPLKLPRVRIETLTHDYDPDCMKLVIELGKVKAFVFEAMGNGDCNSRRGETKNLLEEHDVIAVIWGYLPAANLEILLKISLFAGKSRPEIEEIIRE
ncbi:asparaginase [Fusarium heterosporum]|uniref:Asparaginase n=1 Tax=Fusarium heterosporum TaxID=42747 RepID=A0A8H5SVC0_FUSHE|nr:asparaginase [Fusarium heterosporum]